MIHELRTLAAFAEDLGFVSGTHMWFSLVCNSGSRGSYALYLTSTGTRYVEKKKHVCE